MNRLLRIEYDKFLMDMLINEKEWTYWDKELLRRIKGRVEFRIAKKPFMFFTQVRLFLKGFNGITYLYYPFWSEEYKAIKAVYRERKRRFALENDIDMAIALRESIEED